jgi:hypothetical protein
MSAPVARGLGRFSLSVVVATRGRLTGVVHRKAVRPRVGAGPLSCPRSSCVSGGRPSGVDCAAIGGPEQHADGVVVVGEAKGGSVDGLDLAVDGFDGAG